MNFQQLQYALAVQKHGHFGKAAKSCHITQATLSAMVRKLEEELGYELFDRSRHPIATTELGKAFMPKAQDILTNKNEMFNLREVSTKALSGSLRLGIIPTIANSLLPLVLPPLLRDNPDLQLEISEITTEEIRQQLAMDQIDLGILATPLADDALEESVLYYESMMVYGVGEGEKQFVTTKDIKDKQIWLLEEGHCFRNQAMTICNIQEKENEFPNLHFEGSSFETLLSLTDQFGGYTLVPELYYKEMPPQSRKKTKPFQLPIPVREVSLVSYRPRSRQQTINFMTAAIKQLVTPNLLTRKLTNKDMEIIGI